jgi:hypothetical protein
MTPELLCKAGLDPQALAVPHLMLDDSRPGFIPGSNDVSLLRGGVVFANKVTTVSPTYAQEVYRPEFGCGMQVRIRTLRVMGRTCMEVPTHLHGGGPHSPTPVLDDGGARMNAGAVQQSSYSVHIEGVGAAAHTYCRQWRFYRGNIFRGKRSWLGPGQGSEVCAAGWLAGWMEGVSGLQPLRV